MAPHGIHAKKAEFKTKAKLVAWFRTVLYAWRQFERINKYIVNNNGAIWIFIWEWRLDMASRGGKKMWRDESLM